VTSDPGAGSGPAVGTVEPFEVRIGDDEIADLRRRLADTRWPDAETVEGWGQGVPLSYLRELCAYWGDGYDFGLADRVNAFPQVRVSVDGLGIHALHVRSPEPGAVPLVLTHGWPGSVVEFLKVLGPLTDPRAHGGDPADAFHVVAPSLPGYGWSDAPATTGWGVDRIARAWDTLMGALGYDRYGAQGGDWGATVTGSLAQQVPDRLVGVHVNMATVGPDKSTLDDLSADEQRTLDDIAEHRATGTGYSTQQSTRPQTLGYGVADSPAGQCAWIVEKFWAWTDHDGDPASALTRDEMLDDVSVYWFTNTATSSARLYWESLRDRNTDPIAVPSGISIFPREIYRPSRRWAERRYTDLRWYETLDRGGHFAAYEQPAAFVDQVRGFFRLVR
jgi:epoxide hydrolase